MDEFDYYINAGWDKENPEVFHIHVHLVSNGTSRSAIAAQSAAQDIIKLYKALDKNHIKSFLESSPYTYARSKN